MSVVVINDASSQQIVDTYQNLENINSFEIINMKENRGHARCIASGLKYIFEKKEFDYVIPMDGDGEDRPEEIKNFIQLAEKSDDKTIVGERTKRSESLFFKICYQLHKLLTLGFTGHSIKFGNFTCLSKSTIEKMLNEKASWNSFSGSLKKVEKDLLSIPSIRGIRYFGPSKMSFFNLLKHSLSIISVFRKTVLIRSALFIVFYILLMQSNASIITSTPLILLLIMIYSMSTLSLRENMDEFDKSLENINDIEKIK
jgi:glycosyltransferase involved in cell wall biosynthesis